MGFVLNLPESGDNVWHNLHLDHLKGGHGVSMAYSSFIHLYSYVFLYAFLSFLAILRGTSYCRTVRVYGGNCGVSRMAARRLGSRIEADHVNAKISMTND